MTHTPRSSTGRLTQAHLRGVLGVAFISFSSTLVKLADASPNTVTFFRALYALPVLILLRQPRRAADRRIRRERLIAVGSGLILSVDLMLFHAAIDAIGAALGIVLANLQVLFVAFAAYLVYRDRPSRAAVVALPAVLIGAALLSGLGRADSYGSDPVLGVALGVGSAVAYAAFLMTFRRANTTSSPPAGPLLDATLGAAIGAFILGLFDTSFDLIPSWPSHGWLALMALAVQVAGWLLIGVTLPMLPALAGSFLILLQPVLGLVWGTTLLEENISLVQGLGAALILGGIALVSIRGSVRDGAPEESDDVGQMVGDAAEEAGPR